MWNTLQIDKLKKLACLALSGGEWRVTRERKRGEKWWRWGTEIISIFTFLMNTEGGKSLRLFGHQADPNWAWLSDQQRQTKLILLIYHHQKKSKIKTNYDTFFFIFFASRNIWRIAFVLRNRRERGFTQGWSQFREILEYGFAGGGAAENTIFNVMNPMVPTMTTCFRPPFPLDGKKLCFFF